ncbi:MAG: LysM peptidoglycan-binding domain-containing protein, partial [Streptococcus mitis]|nr:LysM peptidoglycan-binding domain-containing protein [Streptococcus mitis]
MRQTNVRGTLSLRGFRKLRTGAIVATGVVLLGLGFLAPTVSANEQDGVWVARTVAEVKADIQNIDNLSHYTIKWGDTLSAISGATGLSVDSLVEINRIANRDLIFVNNKLYFSEETFLKDGNTEVKRQRVSIDNSGSCQSYEVETKTDTVTGEQTTTVKQTTPVVVETPSTPAPKAEEPATPTPAQPVEDQPAAPGATETPTPAQPVEDQPAAPGATETPTPAQPVEDQPAAPGATETPTPAKPV